MSPTPDDAFGPDAIEPLRIMLEEAGLDRVPNKLKPERPQYRVVRRVSKATGATVPWIRESHLGRNDPCPCNCGKKAKKCERGLALIEAGRWG